MKTKRDISIRPGHRDGFTLVELLVIVGIIALLIGMLLPSMSKFRALGDTAKTQAIINLIDGACQQYFTDFKDYPPSQDGNYSGWSGSELLVLFLTGYGPDWGNNGVPFEGGRKLDTDDGVEGYGFRTVAKKTPYYGPYNGSEKLDTRIDTRPEFVDTFGDSGNPILYYRWTGSSYNANHNSDDPDPNSYAKDSDNNYYRTDFILISSGINEDWNEPKDEKSDDVTNFFNK